MVFRVRRDGHRIRGQHQVVAHQRQVGRCDRRVRAGPHRDAEPAWLSSVVHAVTIANCRPRPPDSPIVRAAGLLRSWPARAAGHWYARRSWPALLVSWRGSAPLWLIGQLSFTRLLVMLGMVPVLIWVMFGHRWLLGMALPLLFQVLKR